MRPLLIAALCLAVAPTAAMADASDSATITTITNGVSLNRIALNRIGVNKLAANKLAANRLSANKLGLNRLAVNGLGSTGRVGHALLDTNEVPFVTVTAIHLADGTKLALAANR